MPKGNADGLGVFRYNSNDDTYGSYASAGNDADSKFVPQVWSRKMLRNFYETTAFNEIANTDYEGEIKAQGDKVVIRTTPDITISDYQIGGALTYQVPEKANKELHIDQAKSWSFQLDDVDEVASDLDLMNKFAEDAGSRLQIAIDVDCFTYLLNLPTATTNRGIAAGAKSADINLGATGTNGDAALAVTKTNATEFIVDFNTVLDEANIPSENRWVVLPAWFCALLKKSDLKSADITGDSSGVLRSGVIGMVDRTKVIQSNNLYSLAEGTATLFYCYAGTTEAITFASQLTKTESLRIQTTFGSYMRGLAVYGREVVQPEAIIEAVAIRG